VGGSGELFIRPTAISVKEDTAEGSDKANLAKLIDYRILGGVTQLTLKLPDGSGQELVATIPKVMNPANLKGSHVSVVIDKDSVAYFPTKGDQ